MTYNVFGGMLNPTVLCTVLYVYIQATEVGESLI